VLRTDNGEELWGKEFDQFCRIHRIARQNTTPYTPQQNGVIERMNRTLMEKAMRMLNDAGLSQDYWEKAVNTSCYVVNKSSTSSLIEKNPYKAWDGKRPSLAHLIVFGCDAFVHIPKERRKKLDSNSKKCIIIRYKDGVKGYKLWNLATRTIVYNRDVIFREVESTSKTEEVKRVNKPEILSLT
jgi:transposase InsO family protein